MFIALNQLLICWLVKESSSLKVFCTAENGVEMRKTVRAILMDQNQKFLFVQHNEANPSDMGKWATVGGGIDEKDQSHAEALEREIREEFEWSVPQDLIVGSLLHTSTRRDRTDFFYFVKINCEEFRIKDRSEVLAFKWFSLSETEALSFFFGFEAELARKVVNS